MPAYVVVDVTIHDPEAYERYKSLTPASIRAGGGRFVVRGPKVEVLEGDWSPSRFVVLEFPTVEAARAWWSGPGYGPAKALRQAIASTRMILVEGVPADSPLAQADPARAVLRHTLATVAYRGGKTLRGAPPEFASFRLGEGTRTPVEILAHIGDLFDWGWHLAQGKHVWNDSKPLPWDEEVNRFFAALERFDRLLASDQPLGFPAEQLFQGPVADALMHFGQLALLRRPAGAPVKGENYFKADIAAGRVGPEQTPPRREF